MHYTLAFITVEGTPCLVLTVDWSLPTCFVVVFLGRRGGSLR